MVSYTWKSNSYISYYADGFDFNAHFLSAEYNIHSAPLSVLIAPVFSPGNSAHPGIVSFLSFRSIEHTLQPRQNLPWSWSRKWVRFFLVSVSSFFTTNWASCKRILFHSISMATSTQSSKIIFFLFFVEIHTRSYPGTWYFANTVYFPNA